MRPFILLLLSTFLLAHKLVMAQAFRNLDKRIERKVNNRVNRKIDRTIDKGLDEAENGASARNRQKEQSKNPTSQTDNKQEKNTEGRGTKKNSSTASSSFSAQSKFDFIVGEKVLAFEDFAQDALGDFPAKWNTDAAGEVMTLTGEEGKWLTFTRSGALTPEFINKLPENFTLEFDLVVSPSYSYYDGSLGVAIASLKNPKDFSSWKLYGDARRTGQNGAMIWLHPQQAGAQIFGHSEIELWEKGKKTTSNAIEGISSFNREHTKVHVAIWRQNQHLRVYLGEEKVWDLPKAFPPAATFNALVFSRHDARDDHNFFIANLRLAAGNPDARHKLLNEGRFSTSGIYFTTASAQIRPESHGVIREIAMVLKENPDVRIHIIGHTDNTGTDAVNRQLSVQRADAVMRYLNQTFGIEKDRMSIAGKGASDPVAENMTAEGKAQNRRVEFVKQ